MPDYGKLVRTAVEAAQKGFRAYHASPHDFERFDMSKIGTGQGAASYGKGIYVAENPAVSGLGGEYWKEFARRTPNDSPEMLAQYFLEQHNFDRAKAAEYARSMEGMYGGYRKDVVEGAANLLATPGSKIGPRVYELQVNKDPSEFLNWDAPLSQQSPSIQERVLSLPPIAKQQKFQTGFLGPDKGITGEGAYGSLEAAYYQPGMGRGGGKEQASAALRDAGIPGIRYLDQGSRRAAEELAARQKAISNPNATLEDAATMQKRLVEARERFGPPTSNAVLFGTDYVDILRKLGIVGAPLGGAALAQQPDQQ